MICLVFVWSVVVICLVAMVCRGCGALRLGGGQAFISFAKTWRWGI